MPIMNDNVMSIFVMDLLLACPKESLQAHMCKKHGWTPQQFEDYKGYYLETMANKDFQHALASINPGEREDEKEYMLNRTAIKIKHGDIYVSDRNKAQYVYLYNPHLFKYMFRRINPVEAIWWEVHDILEHSDKVGNIFETVVLTQA